MDNNIKTIGKNTYVPIRHPLGFAGLALVGSMTLCGGLAYGIYHVTNSIVERINKK